LVGREPGLLQPGRHIGVFVHRTRKEKLVPFGIDQQHRCALGGQHFAALGNHERNHVVEIEPFREGAAEFERKEAAVRQLHRSPAWRTIAHDSAATEARNRAPTQSTARGGCREKELLPRLGEHPDGAALRVQEFLGARNRERYQLIEVEKWTETSGSPRTAARGEPLGQWSGFSELKETWSSGSLPHPLIDRYYPNTPFPRGSSIPHHD
jgi:hypothetical protein